MEKNPILEADVTSRNVYGPYGAKHRRVLPHALNTCMKMFEYFAEFVRYMKP